MTGPEPIHVPVLRDAAVRLWAARRDGAYLDLTVGAGGHLKALSDYLDGTARLYGIDRDPAAAAAAAAQLAGAPQTVTIARGAYGEFETVTAAFGDRTYDGMLMDLGLSSLQLDDPRRGFTFRHDGPLDMRFDPESGGPTAADLVNSLGEKELVDLLHGYGEERRAKRVAQAIVRERRMRMVQTTSQLAGLVERIAPARDLHKTLARVFQAFRIAVNGELEQLAATMPRLLPRLRAGGRLVVISYHSLEDRLVKRFFQAEAKGCVCPPEAPLCACGRAPRLRILTRRAVVPDETEAAANPRA
ncbi:MAG TPA: 16S rRNA (cytosine(1402)-N(4))-methyltransferase RsmH, partial [candidate division Zixibacteria bacterium]|nr:16S rRNA (cytosine(1402)-N(4))-methyltransferase RsmH [candidate division Zixibacteria bacterium]